MLTARADSRPLLIALAVTACTGVRAPSRAAVARPLGGAADGVTAIFYRGAVAVDTRRSVDLAPGSSRIAVGPVPPTLLPGSARLRVIAGPPVQVIGQPALGGSPAALGWSVRAARAGRRRIETRYAAGGATWSAGYTLVLEAGGRRRWARLEGWVALENHTGAALVADRVEVADQRFKWSRGRLAVLGGGGPGRPGRRVRLAGPLRLPPARRVERPLVAGGAARVPVELVALFDPVGDRLDQARRQPRVGRDFGAGGGGHTAIGTLESSVAVDLAAAGIDLGHLPPGPVRVFQRGSDGRLAPLGRADRFATTSGAVLRLAIGPAPGLRGRRRQTDYAYDPVGKRLVEELRIEIENTTARAAPVVVREHLYRGLNWALGYHNGVGRVSKLGPQAIQFRLTVPGHDHREVVYRVVYTW